MEYLPEEITAFSQDFGQDHHLLQVCMQEVAEYNRGIQNGTDFSRRYATRPFSNIILSEAIRSRGLHPWSEPVLTFWMPMAERQKNALDKHIKTLWAWTGDALGPHGRRPRGKASGPGLPLDEDSPETLCCFHLKETIWLFPSPTEEVTHDSVGEVIHISRFTLWVMKEYEIIKTCYKEVE
ncbi:hypothetical protein OSB04_016031 [Centaurea solstitialis]|uniref:Uncharacterized protein n=1 Tax=Centaurea solstitialis TaxID=347529 RepID=A0AA38TDF2_9ASTR|nr:hypothetical protein OSB04_016031 [Centaurea solstitialis]